MAGSNPEEAELSSGGRWQGKCCLATALPEPQLLVREAALGAVVSDLLAADRSSADQSLL